MDERIEIKKKIEKMLNEVDKIQIINIQQYQKLSINWFNLMIDLKNSMKSKLDNLGILFFLLNLKSK